MSSQQHSQHPNNNRQRGSGGEQPQYSHHSRKNHLKNIKQKKQYLSGSSDEGSPEESQHYSEQPALRNRKSREEYKVKDPLKSIDQHDSQDERRNRGHHKHQKSSKSSSRHNQKQPPIKNLRSNHHSKDHSMVSGGESYSSEDVKREKGNGKEDKKSQQYSSNVRKSDDKQHQNFKQQQIPQQQESSDHQDLEDDLDPEEFIEKNFKFAPSSGEDSDVSGESNDLVNDQDTSSIKSYEHFSDKAEDEDNIIISGRNSRRSDGKNLVPLEFAKAHIQKIESDMKRMHERHVKLMREMEENYKLIEQETQEYYIEFLQKWKEIARSKISQYRKALELITSEKESIAREKDQTIDNLNERYRQVLKDKEKLVREYHEELRLRESAMESMKLAFDEENQKKDKEKSQLKKRLDDKININERLEYEIKDLQSKLNTRENLYSQEYEKQQQEFEQRMSEFEQQLNQKTSENRLLESEISQLKSKLDRLLRQLQQQQQQQNTSILSSSGGNGGINSNIIKMKGINPINLQGDARSSLFQRIQGSQDGRNNSTTVTAPATNQSDLQQQTATQMAMRLKNIKRDKIMIQPRAIQLNNKPNTSQIEDISPGINVQSYATQQQLSQQQKDKEEEIKTYYQPQMLKLQHEKKTLVNALNQWKKERKEVYGEEITKIKTSDPIYKDYIRYKQVTEELNNLISQKQQKLDELKQSQVNYSTQQQQTNQQQQQQQQQQVSARGSKSLSPRKYHMMKSGDQSQQQYQSLISGHLDKMPLEEQVKVLRSDLSQLLEENSILQRELQTLVDSNTLFNEHKLAVEGMSLIDNNLREELNALRLKMAQQISNAEISKQMSNMGLENSSLREALRKAEGKLKGIFHTFKQHKEQCNIFNQMKPKSFNSSASIMQQNHPDNSITVGTIMNDDVNISNNNINRSRIMDTSAVSDQQNESIIEDRIRKRLTGEFQQSLHKHLEDAKRGTEQRDKTILTLKDQKKNLLQDIEKARKEAHNYQLEYEKIKERLSVLEKESKENRAGEALIQQQMKESKLVIDRLQANYEFEIIQRKKLHNILEDMKGKIRVFCRVRPMNHNELQMGCISVSTLIDQFSLKIKFKKDGSSMIESKLRRGELCIEGYQEKEFGFDACFGPKATQEEVFEDTKMLLQSAVDGFNVCLFAYGQTGSGKTFTIQGSEDNPGIVPRALTELFEIKQRMEKEDRYRITFECYMVELYMDNLIDLLFPTTEGYAPQMRAPKLDIREDPRTGMVYIQNVTKSSVDNIQQAQMIYDLGVKSRKVSSTDMNNASSRSHLIFSIIVETINNETNQKSKGKISFVDLAGSERVSKANPTVERLKEGKAINQSLNALGMVISNLSTGSHREHVPYRNNKLTHLMKDSLGGNSKTLMFVNISPADYNSQESKMSLYFGEQVKKIQNNVQKNIESQELARLREENEMLKVKMQQPQNSQNSQTLKTTAATASNSKSVMLMHANNKHHQ